MSVAGVSSGSVCRSTTDEANSDAEALFNDRRQSALDSITCYHGYFNESFTIDAYATNCPSNCTAKRLSYTVPANWWLSCESVSDANAQIREDFTSRGVHTEWANEQAESTRCDCPEPITTWSAEAYTSKSLNCSYAGSGDPSISQATVEISYDNQCTSSKSINVSATWNGNSLGIDILHPVNGVDSWIQTGGTDKSDLPSLSNS